MLSIYALLRQSEEKFSSHIAIIRHDKKLSYRELVDDVHTVVRYLNAEGLKSGDRLLVMDGEAESLIKLEIAASYLGLTLIYSYQFDTAWESSNVVKDAQAHWLVSALPKTNSAFEKKCLHYAVPPLQYSQGDLPIYTVESPNVFVQCYTSGTTGIPKGVCLTELNLLFQGCQVATAMHLETSSKILLNESIFTIAGQLIMLSSLYAGAAVIIDGCAYTKVLLRAQQHGATHLMLPPYGVAQALDDLHLEQINLEALELIAYGSAPMSRYLLERAQKNINCLWLQGYGLTETSGPFCWLQHEQHNIAPETVGYPAPGVYLEIRDAENKVVINGEVGEIWVKSPGNMAGYWDAHTSSPQSYGKIVNGWLNTKDLGYLNQEGFLVLKGRLDEIITLAQGFSVYPKELEDALASAPGVIELAIVAIQESESTGQIPVVFLRTNDAHALVLKNLREHAQQRLSPIKHPQYVVFVQTPFARSKSGKIIKQALRNAFNEHLAIPF